MDAKVTLTHHEKNDAGQERREEKSKKRSQGKKKNTFSELESVN